MSSFKPPRQVNTSGDLKRFQKELNHYRWKEGLGLGSFNVRIDGELSRAEQQLWLKLQRKGYKVNENGNLYNPRKETQQIDQRRREITEKSRDNRESDKKQPIVVVTQPVVSEAKLAKEQPSYWGSLFRYFFGLDR